MENKNEKAMVLPAFMPDGFNPVDYLVSTQEPDPRTGELRDYTFLPADIRTAWFYSKNPDGRIEVVDKSSLSKDLTIFAATASIYRNVSDEKPIANATVYRPYYAGANFNTMALATQTAAVSAALKRAGFCVLLPGNSSKDALEELKSTLVESNPVEQEVQLHGASIFGNHGKRNEDNNPALQAAPPTSQGIQHAAATQHEQKAVGNGVSATQVAIEEPVIAAAPAMSLEDAYMLPSPYDQAKTLKQQLCEQPEMLRYLLKKIPNTIKGDDRQKYADAVGMIVGSLKAGNCLAEMPENKKAEMISVIKKL